MLELDPCNCVGVVDYQEMLAITAKLDESDCFSLPGFLPIQFVCRILAHSDGEANRSHTVMATVNSLKDYLKVVRRSGLVDETHLNKLLDLMQQEALPATLDLETASRGLVKAKLVTRWQNQMLMRGLSKGFFLGRYKLLHQIGSGSMARVYLAQHTLMNRRVAIKILHEHGELKESHRIRFQRESHTLGALDHPNIVRIFDFNTDGKFYYLVLEYVAGPTLKDLVRKRGPVSLPTAIYYLRQVAFGLRHIHENQLVHRDLKPGNILVGPEDVVKISDLGLVQLMKQEEDSLTVQDGTMLGTADYLAPEQGMNSHEVGPPADVYSLGCSLFYMLRGEPPFSGDSLAARLMAHHRQPPPYLNPDPEKSIYPTDLDELYLQMMAKRPEDRPTAEQVAQRASELMAEHTDNALEDTVLSNAGSTLLRLLPDEMEPVQAGTLAQEQEDVQRTMRCAGCGVRLQVPRSAEGTTLKCPRCECDTTLLAEAENRATEAF